MAQDYTLGENSRKELAEGLSRILADTYTLYLKTQNFHWNVEGPQFRALHLMFEEQYKALANVSDELAERIRALGHYAPGSYSRFSELSNISEATDIPPAKDMAAQLVADYVTLGSDMKEVISTAEDANDTVTADMLTMHLTEHEKNAWMLRSIIK